MLLALVAASCIAGFVFWIRSEDTTSAYSAANLERQFSRERDRASIPAPRQGDNLALANMLESKQIANSEQRELEQALDKSQAREEALARALAETRELADARQMQLKAALTESQKTVLALARELAEQDTISAAEKLSNAEVTTRDAVSSTGPLNPSMGELNAKSAITGTGPANVHSPGKLNTAGGGWFACDGCLKTPMKPLPPR
jgi:hypothetical protein